MSRWERARREPVALTTAAGVVMIGAYAVLLAVRADPLLVAAYMDSDAATGPVIGETLARMPGRQNVLLGNIAFYPQLLFYEATAGLPGRRELWLAAPPVLMLAGMVAVVAAVWRLAGRPGALFTAIVLVCAAPATVLHYLRPIQHQPAFLGTALLGVFLVVVLLWRPRRVRWVWLAAAGMAAVTAVLVTADELLLPAGMAPLVVAAAVAAATAWTPWTARVLLVTAAVAVSAGLATFPIHQAMEQAGLVRLPHAARLVAWGDIGGHVRLLAEALLLLTNTDPREETAAAAKALKALSGALIALGLAAVFAAAWRHLGRREWKAAAPADVARRAWVAYWAASAAFVAGSFVFSNQAIDVWGARYLPPLLFAIAAAVPFAVRGRGQALALGAALIVGVNGAVALGRSQIPYPSPIPDREQAELIASTARANGLRYGYAHYWNASNVTWLTDFAVRIAPAKPCGGTLCTHHLHIVREWYEDKQEPTFVVVNPGQQGLPGPPPDFGPPVAAWKAGRATIYAYDYDVASRFGTTPETDDWTPARRSG